MNTAVTAKLHPDTPDPVPVALDVLVHGTQVPTFLWQPQGECRGVVLALHGGSGHKASTAILSIVQACLPWGLAVLAIDGPVHGERSIDGNLDPALAKQRFREAWRAGVGHLSVAEDMRAALDALQRQGEQWENLPVGYIGVSMGTAYGLPLLASEPRIRAAAIGLWSTTYPASGHLAECARQVRCPVWFTQQWNDEAFDRLASQALFDALGVADKRLVAYPGGHRELDGERLQDAVRFVASRLLPAD